MPIDFTVGLLHRPGTLADASDALGRAGVNIDGACGYVCEDQGNQGRYHLLVSDPERARRALIDSGFEILAERQVALANVEDRPGAGAALLRRIADAGINVDLLYLTMDGRIVIGGDDVGGIQRAVS